MTDSNFSGRLAVAMTMAQASRRALADAVGISVAAVSLVLSGQTSQMTAENTARAARYLGISMHWLATGEGSMLDDVSPEAMEIARQLDRLDGGDRRRALAMCRLAVFSDPPPPG